MIDVKQRLKQNSEEFLSEISYKIISCIDLNKNIKNTSTDL